MSSSPILARKDPSDVLDYAIDWEDALAADSDTISTSNWSTSSPAGLTVESSPAPSIVGFVTTVWASGGTPYTTYGLTNTIVTTGGRTYQRTISIPVQQR